MARYICIYKYTGWLCLGVLRPGTISAHVRKGTDVSECEFILILQCRHNSLFIYRHDISDMHNVYYIHMYMYQYMKGSLPKLHKC